MDNETDVLAVLAIPVIVQEEDIVSPAPNHRDTLPVKMFGTFGSVWSKTALAEVGGSLP